MAVCVSVARGQGPSGNISGGNMSHGNMSTTDDVNTFIFKLPLNDTDDLPDLCHYFLPHENVATCDTKVGAMEMNTCTFV